MAKEDLKKIKDDLDVAEKHLKRAGDKADRIGDKSNSSKIREEERRVSKIRKDMDEM